MVYRTVVFRYQDAGVIAAIAGAGNFPTVKAEFLQTVPPSRVETLTFQGLTDEASDGMTTVPVSLSESRARHPTRTR